jgi:hypothetical protein
LSVGVDSFATLEGFARGRQSSGRASFTSARAALEASRRLERHCLLSFRALEGGIRVCREGLSTKLS